MLFHPQMRLVHFMQLDSVFFVIETRTKFFAGYGSACNNTGPQYDDKCFWRHASFNLVCVFSNYLMLWIAKRLQSKRNKATCY